MTDREIIFGRLREALSVKAVRPGHHGASAPTEPIPTSGSKTAPLAANARQWLPSVPSDEAGRWELFQKNAINLKASFHRFETMEALKAHLEKMRQEEGWKKIASHQGELTDAVCPKLELPVCQTNGGYDKAELESCDAGITECDALVAQTGSVLVTSRSAGGRALSVLPPHHVVLARSAQLVADLPDAFGLLQRKYADNYPSLISFITGPSRTGDIERILVLGAHGPKRLTILCLD